MKVKLLLVSVVLSIFASAAMAQSVVITPVEVTYTREQPNGALRKTFTVVYPKVKASTPALSRKIETAIGYEANRVFSIKDEMGEFQWLEEAEYEVHYNKNGVLNIWLRTTGTAAYPTYHSRSIVVDLKTGRRVRPIDVFTNINGLVATVKKIQRASVKAEIVEIKKNPDYKNEDTDELFRYTDFTAVNLEGFDVGDDGIAFNYDYGFPRILMPIEPSGYYRLSWADAKPFIKKTGLLGRFVR